MTYRLTVVHGDSDDPTTTTHEAENSHGWEYLKDGFWAFYDGSGPGRGEWDLVVSDLRWATDVKMIEPSGEVAGQTGEESTGQVSPPVSWETGRG